MFFCDQLDGRGGFEEFLDDYSSFGDWCEQKFAKRAAVGTLFADRDEMDAFATVGNENWSGSTYVRKKYFFETFGLRP